MWNYGKWKIVVTKHPANYHLFKNSSQIKNQSGLNFNCQKNNKMLIIWSLVSCFAEFVNDRKLIHSLKALKIISVNINIFGVFQGLLIIFF